MPITDPLITRCTGMEAPHYRSPLEIELDSLKVVQPYNVTRPERGMVQMWMVRVTCLACGEYNLLTKRIPTVHRCDHCQTRDVAIGDAAIYYAWPDDEIPEFSPIRRPYLSPHNWRENPNSPERKRE